MFVELTRRYLIRALHNLENPDISKEENERLYGQCYRLHGHDYQVLVTLKGAIDPVSGLLFDRDQMDGIVRRNLVEPLDGRNLNDIFAMTSGEALARYFFEILKPHFPGGILARVSIQETRKNWFSFNADLIEPGKYD